MFNDTCLLVGSVYPDLSKDAREYVDSVINTSEEPDLLINSINIFLIEMIGKTYDICDLDNCRSHLIRLINDAVRDLKANRESRNNSIIDIRDIYGASIKIDIKLIIKETGEIDINESDKWVLRRVYGAWTLVVPEKINGITVTSISKDAFTHQPYIREVILPDTLSEIGESCFAGSVNLKNINIGKVTRVRTMAFNDCRSLESIYIENAEIIHSYSFARCSNLKEVSISTIGQMHERAFAECNNLSKVTISTASDLFNVDQYTFKNCVNLTDVNLPYATTTISDGAFEACTSLRRIEMDGGYLASVNESAFRGCVQFTGIYVTEDTAIARMIKSSMCSNNMVIIKEGSC